VIKITVRTEFLAKGNMKIQTCHNLKCNLEIYKLNITFISIFAANIKND